MIEASPNQAQASGPEEEPNPVSANDKRTETRARTNHVRRRHAQNRPTFGHVGTDSRQALLGVNGEGGHHDVRPGGHAP